MFGGFCLLYNMLLLFVPPNVNKVDVSKQDILRALGSPAFLQGTQQDVPEQPKSIDLLFKRQTAKTLGMLKVRFLGNALKDFQLVGLASEVSSSTTTTPTFESFRNARKALVESQRWCLVFFLIDVFIFRCTCFCRREPVLRFENVSCILAMLLQAEELQSQPNQLEFKRFVFSRRRETHTIRISYIMS